MSFVKQHTANYNNLNALIREHNDENHTELEKNMADRFDCWIKFAFKTYPIMSIVIYCIKYNRYDLIDYTISVRPECLDCLVVCFADYKDVSPASKEYFLNLIKCRPCFNIYISKYIQKAKYSLEQLMMIDNYYSVLVNVIYGEHHAHWRKFNQNVDNFCKTYCLIHCLLLERYDIYNLLVVQGFAFDCDQVVIYNFVGNKILHHLDNSLISSELIYYICKKGNLFLLKKIADRIPLLSEYLLVAIENNNWNIVKFLIEKGINLNSIRHRLGLMSKLKLWIYRL